jgi:hypothetical protein
MLLIGGGLARAEDGAAVAELTPGAEAAIEKGLEHLVSLQDPKTGCFGDRYRVASTSLGGLALLAGGESCGRGRYAVAIEDALRYVISVRKSLTQHGKPGQYFLGFGDGKEQQGKMHSHGLAMLFLAEVYGQTARDPEVRETLRGAVAATIDAHIALRTLALDERQAQLRIGTRHWGPVVPLAECAVRLVGLAKALGVGDPEKVALLATNHGSVQGHVACVKALRRVGQPAHRFLDVATLCCNSAKEQLRKRGRPVGHFRLDGMGQTFRLQEKLASRVRTLRGNGGAHCAARSKHTSFDSQVLDAKEHGSNQLWPVNPQPLVRSASVTEVQIDLRFGHDVPEVWLVMVY